MNKILRNDLIILDELGYIQFDATGSDHLFQLVAKAYEHRSLIVTSNLDFQDWGLPVALCLNCHRKMHVLDLVEDRRKLQRVVKEV